MAVTSINMYEGPQSTEAPQTGIRVNADAGRTSSIVFRNGEAFDNSRSVERVTSSQINPHYEDGTVFASARSRSGFAVSEVTPDTLITVGGVQAPASFFESQGIVHRGADGRYEEGSGQPQGAQGAPETPEDDLDALTMTSESAKAVDDALEGIPDAHINPLVATAIAVATGELDDSTLVQKITAIGGMSEEEVSSRLSTVRAAYEQQAAAAITGRCGVPPEALQEFYQWARENQKGALRAAVNQQVHANDLSGYRGLADRWFRENPPSIDAVKAGGFDTRIQDKRAEVFMAGRWLSIAAAARLGML
jgi:hypothetical protein